MLPAECQPIADEITDLKQERADLQAELQTGLSGSQKAAVVKQIKALNVQIEEKEKALDKCRGCQPPPPPVTCILSGTLTIRTGFPKYPGPFSSSVALTLSFSGPNHTIVTLYFPATSLGSFAIPYTSCTDTPTINLPGGAATGKYDPATGDIDIPLTLTLSHSLSGGFGCGLIPAGPSTLSLNPPGLTTRTVPSTLSATGTLYGSPLNKTTKNITLVGTAVAVGGVVNGTFCDAVISGTLPCQV